MAELKQETIEFKQLYDYILQKFFYLTVPRALIVDLYKLNEVYSFVDMLAVLRKIEDTFVLYYNGKEFSSDIHRGKYILGAIKNNIDGVAKERAIKEFEQQKKANGTTGAPLENSANNVIPIEINKKRKLRLEDL